MSEREMASLSASSQRIIVFHFPIMSHFLINQYSQIIFTFFYLMENNLYFPFSYYLICFLTLGKTFNTRLREVGSPFQPFLQPLPLNGRPDDVHLAFG